MQHTYGVGPQEVDLEDRRMIGILAIALVTGLVVLVSLVPIPGLVAQLAKILQELEMMTLMQSQWHLNRETEVVQESVVDEREVEAV
jgi:hypothetical protein